MKYIRIHEPGSGVEIPEGKRLLMVVAEGTDGDGNWVPSRTQSFCSVTELVGALKEYLKTGDGVVIRAPSGFSGVAKTLGLPMLCGEWGVL